MEKFIHQFSSAWKQPKWRWALIVAIASDAIGFAVSMWPPVLWVLDGVTVIVLFAVLKFRWPLLPALAVEAVPGLQLFPAWTLVVAALAGTETAPERIQQLKEQSQSSQPTP